MQPRILVTLALAATTALLSACNPVLRTHGYVATADAKPQAVEPGSDTKSSVLARLGNPSVEGTFDDEIETDTWYYMNQVRQSFAYLRPLVEERTITAISFNADGQVEKVAEYGIEDGYYVTYPGGGRWTGQRTLVFKTGTLCALTSKTRQDYIRRVFYWLDCFHPNKFNDGKL